MLYAHILLNQYSIIQYLRNVVFSIAEGFNGHNNLSPNYRPPSPHSPNHVALPQYPSKKISYIFVMLFGKLWVEKVHAIECNCQL